MRIINNLHTFTRRSLTLMLMLAAVCSLFAREYASSSRLASGSWVKISIKDEGMQMLTPAALKQMGFSDPKKVNVYGYGGYRLPEAFNNTTPDDLPLQPVVRKADGSIIFYGAGMDYWETAPQSKFPYHHINNVYATQSVYFLSDRAVEDAAIPKVENPVAPNATPITSFPELYVYEQDLFAPGTNGADLLGEDFRSTTQRSFAVPVIDPVGNEGVTFQVIFGHKSSMPATLAISAEGKSLGNTTLNATGDVLIGLTRIMKNAPFPASSSLPINIKYSNSGLVQQARLDYIEAYYQRALKLKDGILKFRYPASAGEQLIVSGCSAQTRIWDVTDPAAPVEIVYKLEGSDAKFAPNQGLRTYVAFNPEAVNKVPTSIGKVANQDIHVMPTPDMVIISPDAFKAQAERVAQYHRDADGMTVHVLAPEAIYNEFSSGRPDVTAFRKMLKMFYERGTTASGADKLQSCLLFGRPSYDHRMITDVPRTAGYPRLLTWESYHTFTTSRSDTYLITETAAYCNDNYIGMLADSKGTFSFSGTLMDIAIGRMPVKSQSEAKIVVDKLLNYLSNPDEKGAWRNNVMLIADDADNGNHLEQTQRMYTNMINGGNGSDFVYERLYLDSYPLGTGGNGKSFPQAKERMFKMLDEGVSFLSYVGHANPTSWTHEGLMSFSDINSLSYKHLPVIFHASCEFMRFDDDGLSGAEIMWLAPKTGAIAFIAANRKVYVYQNGLLSAALGKHIYRRDAQGRPLTLGEAYRRSINEVTGDGENRHRYAIMGDPAMRIPSPDNKIVIDSIAGQDMGHVLATGQYPVVPARSKLLVSGKVYLPSGAVDTTFNGTLTATLFDAERVIETYGHPSETGKSDGKVIMYNDRKNRLAIASFPVKNGSWEATLFLPDEIENNFTPAKLATYALTKDGREATGASTDFYVYGWDDSLAPDTIPPDIRLMALGNKSFREGDIVSPDTYFLAEMYDESGINISSAGIGRQMMVILDGATIYSDIADYYSCDVTDPTGGSVSYPLSGLSAGDHELTFQVFDNAGNCAKQTIKFKVANAGAIPDVDLRCDANPASTSVNFFISTPHNASQIELEVFDLAGRPVWSTTAEEAAQSSKITWNLCDRKGVRVDRGIYLYRATVTTPDGNTLRRTRKLAVTAP